MKCIKYKRLVYTSPWNHEVLFGSVEYDASLTDDNILKSIHEYGKTEWLPTYPGMEELWLLKMGKHGKYPAYRIEVEEFCEYIPSWWDKLIKKIGRR